LTDTNRDRNTGPLKPRQATAGYQRIGVVQRDHYPAHPGLDHGVRTRGSFPRMATRLQVDVQHRPMRAPTGLLQRVYFRMGAPETLVISSSDNRTIFDDHTADERIGTDKSQ